MNARGKQYTGKGLAKFAEAVSLLMKSPRTPSDLARAMGTTNSAQPYRYIRPLHAEGALYIKDWRPPAVSGRYVPIFAWQPSICAHPDAPKPSGRRVLKCHG